MTAVARLAAVSLDTDDPRSLAAYWRDYLELDTFFDSEDFVALSGGAVLLTIQKVGEHHAPDWPANDVPKQIHLELAVADLDVAEAKAVELGAVKADTQPGEHWRVLLDPAGHPFCITTMIPEVP